MLEADPKEGWMIDSGNWNRSKTPRVISDILNRRRASDHNLTLVFHFVRQATLKGDINPQYDFKAGKRNKKAPLGPDQ
jgi:hypothetical protein